MRGLRARALMEIGILTLPGVKEVQVQIAAQTRIMDVSLFLSLRQPPLKTSFLPTKVTLGS